jgi:hypothetical protein
VFQSLAPWEPNPNAYPIDGAPYGATTAFPNLGSAARLARELAWARQHGIRPVEISEGAGAELARRIASEFGDRDYLYVVTLSGKMFVIPAEVAGELTTHTMAANGEDVIAAGHVQFDSEGNARRWSHRPDDRQSYEVAHAILTLAGLRDSGASTGLSRCSLGEAHVSSPSAVVHTIRRPS